jgi:hypothetical protein
MGDEPTVGEPALGAPGLLWAFSAKVGIGVAQEIGVVDGMRKRIFPITGGSVSGPRLSGLVLPGGADWQSVLPDGTARVFARYTIQAEDGTLISITNSGIRRGPPEILARIVAGDSVDPALYYFRTTPSFEVSDGPLAWLAKSLFVCNAARHRDHVILAFFQIQ